MGHNPESQSKFLLQHRAKFSNNNHNSSNKLKYQFLVSSASIDVTVYLPPPVANYPVFGNTLREVITLFQYSRF